MAHHSKAVPKMAELKILMLNYEFPPIGGGAGKAHLCILNEFKNNSGLNIDVLTSAPKPGFFTDRLSEKVTVYKVGLHKKNLHYWRKCEVTEWLIKSHSRYHKLLRENRYDLVHAFFGFPTGWLCYRTAKQLPYIISLRGSDVPGYNVRLGLDYKLLAGLFHKIWSRASAVVANSEGLKTLASRFMPNLDIGVIPNGIDTEKFHPPENQKLDKPIKALTVCRLISRKRIDLLIKAVAAAKDLGLDIRLNIAGEGNLTETLEQLTVELGLATRVNFLGRVPAEQMPQLYRDNDVLVMSSAHEGMSNAMLEAMASGLPIITTRCEGVEELITDNGIVIEQPDEKLLAEALKALAENEKTYNAMSAAAGKHAQKFTWKSVAQRYIRLYEATV